MRNSLLYAGAVPFLISKFVRSHFGYHADFSSKISFTLVVEWNFVRPPYLFDFCLAFAPVNTTQHKSQWKTVLLKRMSSNPHILDAEDCRRATYTGMFARQDFAISRPYSSQSEHYLFTVKFRVDPQSPWQWKSILDGSTPGELILRKSVNSGQDALSLFDNAQITPDWNVTSTGDNENAQSVKTYLLESKTAIKKTIGSELASLPLTLIADAVRHFSLVRLEPYWLGPRQGKGPFFHIEEDAIICSFLLSNGLVLTLIVLGWVDDVYQVFRSDDQGRVVVAARNDNEDDRHYQVVLAVGSTFHDTMTFAMNQVRYFITSSTKMLTMRDAIQPIVSSLDYESAAKSAEAWHDSLAFCTWNGLGQNLTEEKILDALAQLQANNINISTLLVDDNWQTLGPTKYDYSEPFFRGWSDMEANGSIAPNGLKSLISNIRKQYPSIKDIGVWHALMGYWGGLSPTGSITKDHATAEIEALLMGNIPGVVTTVTASALHDFYSDFYAFLRSAGITFVKTDVQHMLSTFQQASTRRDLVSMYQSAWTAAHLRHFGGKAISCMSQTPQTLFHSLMLHSPSPSPSQSSPPPLVLRNSDDFYPEVPASHPWHVWTNAHNAAFTRHLHVVADWDMFQTDHTYSAYHAAARCVSGGPILITDVPGRHDPALLRQMTATSPRAADAGAVALRTAEPGVTLDVFGLYTDQNVLKVRVAAATTATGPVVGASLLALFNVAEKEIRTLIHVDDFGLSGRGDVLVEEVLVRGHRTGEVFGPISVAASTTKLQNSENVSNEEEEEQQQQHNTIMDKLIHTRLDVRGWEILTAYPVRRVLDSQLSSTTTTVGRRVCVLGLLGKMSGAAAVTSTSVSASSSSSTVPNKMEVCVGLKALGTLGVWFDDGDGDNHIQSNSVVEVYIQDSRVDDKFLSLVTLPQSIASGSAGGSGGGGGSNTVNETTTMPHIWEVDVEAYWREHQLWSKEKQDKGEPRGSREEVVVRFILG